jgi:ABC-type multidrug transport system fused ATPase/permease subunit
VLLDGKNIKDMRLEDFRSQICVVSQTPYLFNDSVINNILYNNKVVAREEVYELAD